jgi:hypothetical protein
MLGDYGGDIVDKPNENQEAAQQEIKKWLERTPPKQTKTDIWLA